MVSDACCLCNTLGSILDLICFSLFANDKFIKVSVVQMATTVYESDNRNASMFYKLKATIEEMSRFFVFIFA